MSNSTFVDTGYAIAVPTLGNALPVHIRCINLSDLNASSSTIILNFNDIVFIYSFCFYLILFHLYDTYEIGTYC